MKHREPRRNVMIKARMRAGAAWSDALILNLSTKGLLVRSDRTPNRGSYLEIRRGRHVIVARVVWSSSGRFGVQTQDQVPIDGLIHDPDGARVAATPASADFNERRAAPRPIVVRHESSRQQGRAIEFAATAFVCAVIAILIGGAVADAIFKPMDAARAALASR